MDKELRKRLQSVGIDVPEPGAVIRLSGGEAITPDIVLESHSYKKWLNLLWIIPIGLLATCLMFLLILLSQNTLVPGNIVGASYNKVGFSMVPNTYSVSPNDLKIGSTIYSASNKPSIPILLNYKTYVVKRVDGTTVYISDVTSQTKDLKQITIFDILYIVQK